MLAEVASILTPSTADDYQHYEQVSTVSNVASDDEVEDEAEANGGRGRPISSAAAQAALTLTLMTEGMQGEEEPDDYSVLSPDSNDSIQKPSSSLVYHYNPEDLHAIYISRLWFSGISLFVILIIFLISGALFTFNVFPIHSPDYYIQSLHLPARSFLVQLSSNQTDSFSNSAISNATNSIATSSSLSILSSLDTILSDTTHNNNDKYEEYFNHCLYGSYVYNHTILNTICSKIPRPSTSHLITRYFPSYYERFPSVLTHLPQMNCTHGTYIVLDTFIGDGMGNALYIYQKLLNMAILLNATLVDWDWSRAYTHTTSEEDNESRENFWLHREWAINRNDYDRCSEESPVKKNKLQIEKVTIDWDLNHMDFLKAKQFIYSITGITENNHNNNQLNFTYNSTRPQWLDGRPFPYILDDLSISPSLPYASHTGLTIYFPLTFAASKDYVVAHSSVSVAIGTPVIEQIRYWSLRRNMRLLHYPHQLASIRPSTFTNINNEIPSISTLPSFTTSITNTPSIPLSALHSDTGYTAISSTTSDFIHIGVIIRRGDVTRGTSGNEVRVPVDMRGRVIWDETIVQIIQEIVNVIRKIQPGLPSQSNTNSHNINNNNNNSTNDNNTTNDNNKENGPIYSGFSDLDGNELVNRLSFTIYSEGDMNSFESVKLLLNKLIKIESSHIQFHLNGKSTTAIALTIESDLLILSPSSFSYANCYYNSESLKIGSGWNPIQFACCRGYINSEWHWSWNVEWNQMNEQEKQIGLTKERAGPQQWLLGSIENQEIRKKHEIQFAKRFVRLIQRKYYQRKQVMPLFEENWAEDYPLDWLYASN